MERFKCENVNGILCYVRCGGDYRVPETGSALLWDLPCNQCTEGGALEEGRVVLDGRRISVFSFR